MRNLLGIAVFVLALSIFPTALADVHHHDRNSRISSPSSHSPSTPSSLPGSSLARPAPSGDILLHDASGVVYDNASSLYFLFSSGIRRGELLAVHASTDGYAWKRGPDFLTAMPEWVRLKVPNTEPGWWAPDVIFLNGWWHVYYAVSSGGSQHSCIALAVNRALSDSDPDFRWLDAGPVLCSTAAQPWNCIDVHAFVSSDDGSVWMNWGSYWHGIFVQQLQGFPIVSIPVGDAVHVATHNVENHPIEAAWVQPWPSASRAGQQDFWLFVDWEYADERHCTGRQLPAASHCSSAHCAFCVTTVLCSRYCCRGLNSTYDIRVGRSISGPAGPYLDRDGVDMLQGGGSEFLGTEPAGRQIGPGQIGFPWGGPQGTGGPQSNLSQPIVSFFYYDRHSEPAGQFTLGQAMVTWEGEGEQAWPVASQRL